MRCPPTVVTYADGLFALASEQAGYFTAAQAKEVGYSYQAQAHHVAAGNWLRIERGLFRLAEWIPDVHDDLVRWSLWSRGRGGRLARDGARGPRHRRVRVRTCTPNRALRLHDARRRRRPAQRRARCRRRPGSNRLPSHDSRTVADRHRRDDTRRGSSWPEQWRTPESAAS